MYGKVKRVKNKISDDIVADRFINFGYKPLSRKEELSVIKKLKLSYYDEVSEEEKELYLNYFFEEFPNFKEKYINASNKEEVLNEAIELAFNYRDYFLENNMRLVFSIAKKFESNGIFEDLFQEGVYGMMRALKKYDVESGNKFSTYATCWIRQMMVRFLHKNNKIVISENVNEYLYSYVKVRDDLEKKLCRTPSNKEISEAMGINEKTLNRVLLADYYNAQLSLDEPLWNDQEKVLADLVFDESDFASEIDDKLSLPILKEEFLKENIGKKAKKILSMHYGIDSDRVYTLREISEVVNMSERMVKKMERRAFNKLRENVNIRELYGDGEVDLLYESRAKVYKK